MPMDNDLREWWDGRCRQETAERWREDFQLAIRLGVPNPVEWASLASLATKEGEDVPIGQALSQCESTRGDEPR